MTRVRVALKCWIPRQVSGVRFALTASGTTKHAPSAACSVLASKFLPLFEMTFIRFELAAKTKALSAQVRPSSHGTLILDGVPLEEVALFKYIGTSFTATGKAVREITARINLARATFNRVRTSLWSRNEPKIVC